VTPLSIVYATDAKIEPPGRHSHFTVQLAFDNDRRSSRVFRELFRAISANGQFAQSFSGKSLLSVWLRRPIHGRGPVPSNNTEGNMPMSWTTPTLVEVCIGLEINGYLPPEF
jgi:coenzyme PQQ precursor peptide PqqA